MVPSIPEIGIFRVFYLILEKIAVKVLKETQLAEVEEEI